MGRVIKRISQKNIIYFLQEYEKFRLDYKQELKLFSYLIKTSLAWRLQGLYGRRANELIRAGVISKSGKINWKKARQLLDQYGAIF